MSPVTCRKSHQRTLSGRNLYDIAPHQLCEGRPANKCYQQEQNHKFLLPFEVKNFVTSTEDWRLVSWFLKHTTGMESFMQ